MIIGYYEQSFFGGGTYYKLSKRTIGEKCKIEYAHSDIPNVIPNANEYIKKYETLRIEDNEGLFEGKIKENYIEYNSSIETIEQYISNCDWDSISKKEYNNKNVAVGVTWYFFIELGEIKYEIRGYEDFPIEVINIIKQVDIISRKYLDSIIPNRNDMVNMNKYRKKNISFMKYLYKKKLIDKDKYKESKLRYKKKFKY